MRKRMMDDPVSEAAEVRKMNRAEIRTVKMNNAYDPVERGELPSPSKPRALKKVVKKVAAKTVAIKNKVKKGGR